MTARRLIPLIAILVVAGAAATAWWLQRGREPAEDRLVLHGNVEIREARLAFEVDGRISGLEVQEGDRVEAGQRLAELATERYRDAVDMAAARLDAARARLRRLEAGSRPEEIQRARAELEAAEATARNAEGRYQRLSDMAGRELVSPQDVDDARSAAEAARARMEAAREGLGLLLAGPRREEIDEARSQARAEEAALDGARRNLRDTVLRAPAAGTIRTRILEPGDMASPQQPVYTLALEAPVWVRVYLPEPALGRTRPGMPAFVTGDSYPDRRYRAWIGHISPTAEFMPKTVETEEVRPDLVYQARVLVCEPRGELRLGMPVTVTVPLDGDPTAGGDPCAEEP